MVGCCYVLDEPTIGLHQRDNDRLIGTLRSLTDIGNSVLVVEHDEDMIGAADWVIDVGPGPGRRGGRIVGEVRTDHGPDLYCQLRLILACLDVSPRLHTPEYRAFEGTVNLSEIHDKKGEP